MKRIPDVLQDQIKKLHSEGKEITEIMHQLSLSRSFVYRVLGEAGAVRPSSVQKDMTPKILRRYFEGKSVYEVAKELGISKSTVHRVVASANAVRPKKGSKNPAVAVARRKSVTINGKKLCTGCNEFKDTDKFSPFKDSLDGLRPRCHKCTEIQSNKWRKTPAGAAYHKLKMRAYSKRVRQATPQWVDKSACNEIYKEAIRKQEQEGITYEVDHIVPIRGKDVSGLHVPWNLQVLPAVLNARKSNKHLTN